MAAPSPPAHPRRGLRGRSGPEDAITGLAEVLRSAVRPASHPEPNHSRGGPSRRRRENSVERIIVAVYASSETGTPVVRPVRKAKGLLLVGVETARLSTRRPAGQGSPAGWRGD